MHRPALPVDESERLMALHRLEILDKPAPEALWRAARLAAKCLDAPLIAVSFMDSDRQWPACSIGPGLPETPRHISFCAHAILSRDAPVIADAVEDPRFADSPFVVGAPHVRAYLGIPLISLDGFAVGTLCAMDFEPRPFRDEDIDTMAGFARIIEESIHAKERESRIRESMQTLNLHDRMFQATFDLATVGIVHTTVSGKLFRMNPRASELLGYTADDFRSIRMGRNSGRIFQCR